MTDPAPNYQLEPEETVQQSRLAAKFKESPLFVIGIGGWVGLVGYGLYTAKSRGPNTSLAMHLIQTRVIAQTAVIGGVTIGVGYQLFNKIFHSHSPASESK